MRLILLLLLASATGLFWYCAKQDPAPVWNNPMDPQGENWFPPTVTAVDTHSTVAVNDSITLSSQGADENGQIIMYYWALDGSHFNDSTQTAQITVSFVDTGEQTVLVRVRDNHGLVSAIDTITFRVKLFAPTIVPMADTVVKATDTAWVHAAGQDSNGTVDKYYWDAGDDGWDDSTDTGLWSFAYAAGGNVKVVVSCRDDDNIFSSHQAFYVFFNRVPSSVSLLTPVEDTLSSGYNNSTKKWDVNMTWQAADPDGNLDTLNYTLLVDNVTPPVTNIYTGTNTNYTPALDTGALYYWQVQAMDLAGNTVLSSIGSFYAPALYIPDSPAGVSAVVLSWDKIRLNWTACEFARNYRILYSEDGTNFQAIDTVTDTFYVDSGLTDLKPYWYKVVANSDDGSSGPSAAISAITEGVVDLEVTKVEMLGGCLFRTCDTVYVLGTGSTSFKVKVAVKNKGSLTANSVVVQTCFSQDKPYQTCEDVQSCNISSIGPGQTASCEEQYTIYYFDFMIGKKYYFVGKADRANVIVESDETNNIGYSTNKIVFYNLQF